MDEEKLSILSQGRAVMERSGPLGAPDVGSVTFDIYLLGLHLLHVSVPHFASVYLLCLPLGSQPLCSFHSPGRWLGQRLGSRQGHLATESWDPLWPNPWFS